MDSASALPHDSVQLDGDPAVALTLPAAPSSRNAAAHPAIGTFADRDRSDWRPTGSGSPSCSCELTPLEPKLLQISEGVLTSGARVGGGPGLKAYQKVASLLPDLANTPKLASFIVFCSSRFIRQIGSSV